MALLSPGSRLASLILCACVVDCAQQPADKPLGKVTSPGAFRIDEGRANASATVFEGSTVETDSEPATVFFEPGIVIRLAAQTAITARSGSVVLSKGETRIQGNVGLRFSVARIEARPSSGETVLEVQFVNDRISIKVAKGSAAVLDGNTPVARLLAGNEMRFLLSPADPRGLLAVVTGCLRKRSDGGLYIVDDALHRPVDVTGDLFGSDKGNTVQISGSLRPLPVRNTAAAVVEVVLEKRIRDGCGDVPYVPFIITSAAAATGNAVNRATRPGSRPPVSIP